MMLIDTHAHVFTKASSEFPRETSELFPPDREEPVEKLLARMDLHGVEQAVLVQWGGSSFEHHSYLLRCLKDYSEKFIGIGAIDVESPHPEMQMDRLADATGIAGFKLESIGGPRDPFIRPSVKELKAYRIWKHAAERGYVIWLYPRAIDAHLVPYLLEAFPVTRLVLTRLGLFPGKDKLSWDDKGRPRVRTPTRCSQHLIHTTHRLIQYENVVVQLAAQYAYSNEPFPYRDFTPCHQTLFKIYGARRLMWGADFPWTETEPGYGRLTGIVRELLPDLPEGDYDEIMGGAARRFLGFPSLKNASQRDAVRGGAT
jgi:predicted TIM-barrel fold metal-dependent hydrolase